MKWGEQSVKQGKKKTRVAETEASPQKGGAGGRPAKPLGRRCNLRPS